MEERGRKGETPAAHFVPTLIVHPPPSFSEAIIVALKAELSMANVVRSAAHSAGLDEVADSSDEDEKSEEATVGLGTSAAEQPAAEQSDLAAVLLLFNEALDLGLRRHREHEHVGAGGLTAGGGAEATGAAEAQVEAGATEGALAVGATEGALEAGAAEGPRKASAMATEPIAQEAGAAAAPSPTGQQASPVPPLPPRPGASSSQGVPSDTAEHDEEFRFVGGARVVLSSRATGEPDAGGAEATSEKEAKAGTGGSDEAERAESVAASDRAAAKAVGTDTAAEVVTEEGVGVGTAAEEAPFSSEEAKEATASGAVEADPSLDESEISRSTLSSARAPSISNAVQGWHSERTGPCSGFLLKVR